MHNANQNLNNQKNTEKSIKKTKRTKKIEYGVSDEEKRNLQISKSC